MACFSSGFKGSGESVIARTVPSSRPSPRLAVFVFFLLPAALRPLGSSAWSGAPLDSLSLKTRRRSEAGLELALMGLPASALGHGVMEPAAIMPEGNLVGLEHSWGYGHLGLGAHVPSRQYRAQQAHHGAYAAQPDIAQIPLVGRVPEGRALDFLGSRQAAFLWSGRGVCWEGFRRSGVRARSARLGSLAPL